VLTKEAHHAELDALRTSAHPIIDGDVLKSTNYERLKYISHKNHASSKIDLKSFRAFSVFGGQKKSSG
jgi:hypothetical protein